MAPEPEIVGPVHAAQSSLQAPEFAMDTVDDAEQQQIVGGFAVPKPRKTKKKKKNSKALEDSPAKSTMAETSAAQSTPAETPNPVTTDGGLGFGEEMEPAQSATGSANAAMESETLRGPIQESIESPDSPPLLSSPVLSTGSPPRRASGASRGSNIGALSMLPLTPSVNGQGSHMASPADIAGAGMLVAPEDLNLSLTDDLAEVDPSPLPFAGWTPTAGFTAGRWEYICVDPKGLRLRNTTSYAKSCKTGGELRYGQVIDVCERGMKSNMIWLCISDGRGWAFERSDRRRMSEVRYANVPANLQGRKHMIRPQLGRKLDLYLSPLSGKVSASLHPGSIVTIQKMASILLQGPSKSEESKNFFLLVTEENLEGWTPELVDIRSTAHVLVDFQFERLVGDAGKTHWISVLPKCEAPLYPTPGRMKFPARKLKAGELAEVVERCTANQLNFYRLEEGGWVCATAVDGRRVAVLSTREKHSWQYSCTSKRGTAIRVTPTRAKNQNTGRRLKHRQRVVVSEQVVLEDGDAFLRLEPPHHGWVPVKTLAGEMKMQPMQEVEPSSGSPLPKNSNQGMLNGAQTLQSPSVYSQRPSLSNGQMHLPPPARDDAYLPRPSGNGYPTGYSPMSVSNGWHVPSNPQSQSMGWTWPSPNGYGGDNATPYWSPNGAGLPPAGYGNQRGVGGQYGFQQVLSPQPADYGTYRAQGSRVDFGLPPTYTQQR
eukprot:gnl/TRDRNA2_/TRDRNA2_151449_c0_seq1.p1 gnl/TRDRNA2_/TRDRNA2_151449_c0~~gnl/TRDRNA2_/TRDRNA2_151449_c0_seq1.p1  ORF type:complete len:728 (-),score=100.28 gnl/TRDRNA2_/TRDRNA2_151449_c0_seq1:71-2212(-)